MDEQEPSGETVRSSKPPKLGKLNLQQAVDMGEYDPENLANFSEWHTLSTYLQFQLVRKALDIRYRQLMLQYAELNNVLDLREKLQVQQAIKNVEKQLRLFEQDREDLFVYFTNKMSEE